MTKLTIVGSLNYDVVTTTARIPGPGETIHAQSFETHHGGKGANQALATRRLSPESITVQMIGRVGDDAFGKELVDSMAAERIDMSLVAKVGGSTGVATILVDPESGENRIMVFPGANGTLKVEDITAELLHGSDTVILQNEIPLDVVYHTLKIAHEAGIKTIYNPSPVQADTPAEVFKYVDVLVVNSTEAEVLAGWSVAVNDSLITAEKLLPELQSKLQCKTIIVTLGANGSIFVEADAQIKQVAAVKVDKIVDTTGAGDTFLGALASQVAQHIPLEQALKFASKASAVAVTRNGAAEGIPRLSEL